MENQTNNTNNYDAKTLGIIVAVLLAIVFLVRMSSRTPPTVSDTLPTLDYKNELIENVMDVATKVEQDISPEEVGQIEKSGMDMSTMKLNKKDDGSATLSNETKVKLIEKAKFSNGKLVKFSTEFPDGGGSKMEIDFDAKKVWRTEKGKTDVMDNQYEPDMIMRSSNFLLNAYKEPFYVRPFMTMEKTSTGAKYTYKGNNPAVVYALTRSTGIMQPNQVDFSKLEFMATYEYDMDGRLISMSQEMKDGDSKNKVVQTAELKSTISDGDIKIEDKSNKLDINQKNAEDIKVVESNTKDK